MDIWGGLTRFEFWMTFGMNDIKAKYRRSALGQLWITLSVAVFIVVIGGLYKGIFSSHDGSYLTYLGVGYILWLFISDSLNTGCTALIKAKNFMLQREVPVSTFSFRLIYREFLTTLHHLILLPPIFIWANQWPGFENIAISIIGFTIVIFTTFWAILFLSIVSLRYRDIQPVVTSLVRMAFFATPIIWIERDLGPFGNWVTLFNPFGYFLKVVRNPLLSESVLFLDWIVVLILAFATMFITLITLAISKNKLVYWY